MVGWGAVVGAGLLGTLGGTLFAGVCVLAGWSPVMSISLLWVSEGIMLVGIGMSPRQPAVEEQTIEERILGSDLNV